MSNESMLSSKLIKHKLIHSAEKPFQYPFCHRAFTNLPHFTTYKRRHSEEKLFQYPICLKDFAESSKLTRHKLIHTGKKTFQCIICQKAFTQSTTLNKHKQSHNAQNIVNNLVSYNFMEPVNKLGWTFYSQGKNYRRHN